MGYFRVAALAVPLMLFTSCAKPPAEAPAAQESSASARLEAIPAADASKYGAMRDLRGWRNPYLIIRTDGIGLLDAANHEQRLIKPEELAETLAQLAPEAWPYGRVVAVAVNGVPRTKNDKVHIRRNRAMVAGTLESMKVLINWVPAA